MNVFVRQGYILAPFPLVCSPSVCLIVRVVRIGPASRGALAHGTVVSRHVLVTLGSVDYGRLRVSKYIDSTTHLDTAVGDSRASRCS